MDRIGGKPYTDAVFKEFTFRFFSKDLDPNDLVWHRDATDRTVTPRCGDKWQFQFDDTPPFIMNCNETFFIPANTYHRIIKGNGNLLLEIKME